MLTFSPTVSFQSDDKAPDFSELNVEDTLNNCFSRSQGSYSFEYDHHRDNSPVDDDTSSSGMNVSYHGFDRVMVPTTSRRCRFPQLGLRCTQSEEILPSQASAGFGNPGAAISGAELLKLEGKTPVQTFPIRPSLRSSPAMPVPPSLRRTTKFNAETLRHRNQNTSKSPGNRVIDPSKTMRASYRYQQETTTSLKWTQENYEQFMLQARANSLSTAHPPPGPLPYCPPPDTFSHLDGSLPRRPAVARRQETIGGDRVNPTSISPQQLSIGQHASTSTDSLDFTIRPSENRSNWPPDSVYSCHGRVGCSQLAHCLAQTHRTDSSADDCMMQSHQYITEDPSDGYYVMRRHQYQSTSYPPKTSPVSQPRHTIPSSPSPPPPAKPPFTHCRPSRSSRRKQSAGALGSSGNTIGFVNYTPDDSQKILAGVAPSGSSKTKVKRDQEALEK